MAIIAPKTTPLITRKLCQVCARLTYHLSGVCRDCKHQLDPDEPCPCCGIWWIKEGSTERDPPPCYVPTVPDKGWIQTASGGRFYFLESRLTSVTLADIAKALSKLCRYTGHCRKFFSVAEHSYYVSLIVPEEHQFHALLHDASEAYLNDMSTPLKSMMDEYRVVEDYVSRAIYARFDLPDVLHPCIKQADYRCLASEVPLLFDKVDAGWEGWLTGHKPLEELTRESIGWLPEKAEDLFMERANYLWLRHTKHRPVVSPPVSEPLDMVRGTPLIQYQVVETSQ